VNNSVDSAEVTCMSPQYVRPATPREQTQKPLNPRD
jgi:hypothetical protein